jgi:serine-type D-Ala-D-Ala carboxypeptidase (penicillin-binding protein 5/6)
MRVKIFLGLLIFGFLTWFFADFVPGYIKSNNTYEVKEVDVLYDNTLLVFYPPEPEWSFGEKLGTDTQPEISAESAILVDLNSGNILFEKNSSKVREIASLVKIMTAVVALEHKDLDDKLSVSSSADAVGENSMSITEGEIYTLRELLYGLVLHSGNDAAYTISENVAGDVPTFVSWMNRKAGEIGMKDTKFFDSHGLDDKTRSSARDLVRLTRYALKSPDFREVVGTLETELPYSEQHKYLYLYNQTNLLSSYPGVLGVKTGYTEDAGLCLVTYAVNDGVELVGIVLDATDRKGDMGLMLDHGFGVMGVVVEHNLFDSPIMY